MLARKFPTTFTPQGDGNYLIPKSKSLRENYKISDYLYPARGRKHTKAVQEIVKRDEFPTTFTPQGDGNVALWGLAQVSQISFPTTFTPQGDGNDKSIGSVAKTNSALFPTTFTPQGDGNYVPFVNNAQSTANQYRISDYLYPARGRKLRVFGCLLVDG